MAPYNSNRIYLILIILLTASIVEFAFIMQQF
nr:MAG TPA: hypothetical protein [Caudoviricetes sp.]